MSGFVPSLKGLRNKMPPIPSTHVLGYACAALRAAAIVSHRPLIRSTLLPYLSRDTLP